MPGADAQKLPGWAQGGYPNRADAQTLPGWVQGGYPQSADAVEGECGQMDACFEGQNYRPCNEQYKMLAEKTIAILK